MKPKIPKDVLITAIIAITLMEIVALLIGINGVLLTTVLVIVAGLAGWTLPQPRIK